MGLINSGRRVSRLLTSVFIGVALALPAWAGPLDGGLPDYPPPYHPVGMDAWDFWYARSGATYYAFYMQTPIDAPVRFANPTIGVSSSPDLVHWTGHGEVLRANPPGQWNDAWVATGSVWSSMGLWWMLFTGQTYTGPRGFGLAKSTDLMHWTRVGTEPIELPHGPFIVPTSPYWQARGFSPGESLGYTVIADPYVMPAQEAGWFYMVSSAIFDDESLENRGCTCLMRSRDGQEWEACGLIAAPGLYNEMESPQIWEHGGRWYLLFGAARYDPLYRATMVYLAPSIQGPFEPSPAPELILPDYTGWFYGGKVVTDPRGQDVLLAVVSNSVSNPYTVTYELDGSLSLTPYQATDPPAVTHLDRIAPNPTSGEATIDFALARGGAISLSVHDLSGRRVRTIESGQIAAGGRRALWDGRDDEGRGLPAGVYFVRLGDGARNESRRIVIAK